MDNNRIVTVQSRMLCWNAISVQQFLILLCNLLSIFCVQYLEYLKVRIFLILWTTLHGMDVPDIASQCPIMKFVSGNTMLLQVELPQTWLQQDILYLVYLCHQFLEAEFLNQNFVLFESRWVLPTSFPKREEKHLPKCKSYCWLRIVGWWTRVEMGSWADL